MFWRCLKLWFCPYLYTALKQHFDELLRLIEWLGEGEKTRVRERRSMQQIIRDLNHHQRQYAESLPRSDQEGKLRSVRLCTGFLEGKMTALALMVASLNSASALCKALSLDSCNNSVIHVDSAVRHNITFNNKNYSTSLCPASYFSAGSRFVRE